MQKKQATRLEQLKQLKARREEVTQPKKFQASKGIKTPKARPW